MAASKKAPKKAKVPTPAEAAAIRKSFLGIVAQHKKLDLMLQQHRVKVTPMFFAL
jgi:hypothetical protein